MKPRHTPELPTVPVMGTRLPDAVFVGIRGGFLLSVLGDRRTGWVRGHRSAAVDTSGRQAALDCAVAWEVHGVPTG